MGFLEDIGRSGAMNSVNNVMERAIQLRQQEDQGAERAFNTSLNMEKLGMEKVQNEENNRRQNKLLEIQTAQEARAAEEQKAKIAKMTRRLPVSMFLGPKDSWTGAKQLMMAEALKMGAVKDEGGVLTVSPEDFEMFKANLDPSKALEISAANLQEIEQEAAMVAQKLQKNPQDEKALAEKERLTGMFTAANTAYDNLKKRLEKGKQKGLGSAGAALTLAGTLNGEPVYETNIGRARIARDESGALALIPVLGEEAKHIIPSFKSASTDLQVQLDRVAAEHPDWPYLKIRNEAASRVLNMPKGVTASGTMYDEAGNPASTVSTVTSRGGAIENKTAPLPQGGGALGGKPTVAPATVQNDAKQLVQIRTDFSRANRLMNPNETGVFDGRLGKYKNMADMTADQKRAEMYASIQGIYNVFGKERSGANFTIYEEARLNDELPRRTDSWPVLQGKMKVLQDRINNNVNTYRELWREYPGARKTLDSAFPINSGGLSSAAQRLLDKYKGKK